MAFALFPAEHRQPSSSPFDVDLPIHLVPTTTTGFRLKYSERDVMMKRSTKLQPDRVTTKRQQHAAPGDSRKSRGARSKAEEENDSLASADEAGPGPSTSLRKRRKANKAHLSSRHGPSSGTKDPTNDGGAGSSSSWLLSRASNTGFPDGSSRSTATTSDGGKAGRVGQLQVTFPSAGLMQCQSAFFTLLGVPPDVPVSVSITDARSSQGGVGQQTDIILPPPVTTWNWTAVNFPARTMLRFDFRADPDEPTSAKYATYFHREPVRLGDGDTTCLNGSNTATSAGVAAGGGANGVTSIGVPADGSRGRDDRQHINPTHTTIIVIAAVLGLVLVMLIALIVYMNVRQRQEKSARKARETVAGATGMPYDYDDDGEHLQSGSTSVAARIQPRQRRMEMLQLSTSNLAPGPGPPPRCTTLSPTGPGVGRWARAILRTPSSASATSPTENSGRGGGGPMAGLRYMARLVPGLEPSRPVAEPGGMEGVLDTPQSQQQHNVAAVGTPERNRNRRRRRQQRERREERRRDRRERGLPLDEEDDHDEDVLDGEEDADTLAEEDGPTPRVPQENLPSYRQSQRELKKLPAYYPTVASPSTLQSARQREVSFGK